MDSGEKLFSKKHIIYLLVLLIMVVAIPLGVRLVERQTQLQSKASEGGQIEFADDEGVTCTGNSCTTTTKDVKIRIKAPDFE